MRVALLSHSLADEHAGVQEMLQPTQDLLAALTEAEKPRASRNRRSSGLLPNVESARAAWLLAYKRVRAQHADNAQFYLRLGAALLWYEQRCVCQCVLVCLLLF